ncbi:hypothetical protein [Thiomonas sp.]|jgi:hypothetical protein|uniref:hypothetical protein n=1 Tax=Thiomonas sp. TaxID=2047785 RepID=UPI0026186EB9|nr:hypothetical protein [Thiomonas sp.]
MSGKSPQESQARPYSDSSRRVAVVEDGESLLAMVERAVEYLDRDADPPLQGSSPYARAFPVGEAIGRLFWKRCVESEGPHGLALLIEHMLDLSPATGGDRIRRALYSGFCWQLEQLTHESQQKTGGAANCPIEQRRAEKPAKPSY